MPELQNCWLELEVAHLILVGLAQSGHIWFQLGGLRVATPPQASAPTAATAASTSSGVFRMLHASRANDRR